MPKTRIAGNAFVPLERSRALTEPVGGRIIEVSNDDRNIFDGEPGNPRVGWTAYVPPGSVAKGREIVTTGGVMRVGNDVVPRTTACSGCHGPDLMGMDDAPPLAGRSASYLARQLYDFQREARIGRSAAFMRVVVANLTDQDMVAITAYLASLPPVKTSRPLTQPLGNATRLAHRELWRTTAVLPSAEIQVGACFAARARGPYFSRSRTCDATIVFAPFCCSPLFCTAFRVLLRLSGIRSILLATRSTSM